MAESLLSHCRIVLVKPHYAGNLGSVARSMCNFGLRDLVLVAPYTFPANPEARRLATHGEGVLDSARIVPELRDALADCVFTLATSALTAGVVRRGMIGTPAELAPRLLEAAASGPVALVFGPEPHGLSNEEIGQCHGMVHIPVDPEFSSLNLAQAVTVCCYELRKAWSARTTAERTASGQSGAHAAPTEPLLAGLRGRAISAHADLERMYEHLQEALREVGFLFGERQGTLMHSMRQLIGRALPTPQEVRMLHGLARQLLWIASQRTGLQDTEELGDGGTNAPLTPPSD